MDKYTETLQMANDYVLNLEKGINTVIDKVNSGKIYDAIKLVPFIADGIEWLISAIELTKKVQKKYIDTNSIIEGIDNVVMALENDDFMLMVDIFQYEVLNSIIEIGDSIKENLKFINKKYD